MKSVKEISKWLKEEVEFLKENEDYCGGWLKLDDTYAAVVLWEEGWGTEPRDDVMQSKESPDWALCAGVKIFNPADTVDGWLYPSNKEGDMLCESAGITPDEDYDELAKWIVDCYDVVKDFVPGEDGVIDVVEESLNEGKGDRKVEAPNGWDITELKTFDDVESNKADWGNPRWEIIFKKYFDRYKENGTKMFVYDNGEEKILVKCHPTGECVAVDWSDMPVKVIGLVKEDMEDEEIGVKSGPSIGNPDAKHIPNNKDDAKAPTQLRKNTTTNNKSNAEESLKEELDDFVSINPFKSQYNIPTEQMEQALKKQGIKFEYAKKSGDEEGFYVESRDYDKAIKVLLELESDWEIKHSKQESICEEKEEVEEIAISSKEAAFDVLKKILDIHCEKGKCTIALKGTLDDEDEVKLYTELSEEDVESLCPEFHCEEESDEIKFSDSDEEVELVTIGSDEEEGEIYDFSDFEEEEPVILD